jgi:hypothetical protein
MITAVWDLPEDRAKEASIKRAESANWRNVHLAREVARELAQDGRELCADEDTH